MNEEIRIGTMGRQGDGIAETAAGRLHVAFTIPGELVEVSQVGERGDLVRIIESSKERRVPVCKHFGACGGCALQHWAAEPYHAWKRSLVVEALARAGVEASVAPAMPAQGLGRTRAVFHTGRGHKKDALGFARRRSHEIIEIEECPVLDPRLAAALPLARELARILAATGKSSDLHFTLAGEGLDIDIRGPGKLAKQVESKIVAFAAKRKIPRISLHGEQIVQLAPPVYRIGSVSVQFPPGPFLQATAEGERILAEKVLQAAAGAKSAADLFSGIGTFAFRLATLVKVAAFDNHEPSIAALSAAAKAPGLKPVVGAVRDLFRWPLVVDELKKFDFVVLDPPRQGANAQVQELAKSKVKKIVYVSCDAETFARDARTLIEGGYTLDEVTPVDQFLYSPHIELTAVFRR